MTIVIAPNAYKGTLSALEACHAILKGMKPVLRHARFIVCPLADGGDGTLEVLKYYDKGYKTISCPVTNPEGLRISASFLLHPKRKEAFIESAEASGMKTLKSKKKDVMKFTSYGTGELILKALDAGAKKITVGIGGTATNDGGFGMLRALGMKFYGKKREEIKTLSELPFLQTIDTNHMDARLKETQFVAACDVRNPLLGAQGATYTYGGQKGAGEKEKILLEQALTIFADKTRKKTRKNVNREFCGAGGGLGAALYGYLKAFCVHGYVVVASCANLTKKMEKASLIITGEGRVDAQTKFGKVPYFIARFCKANKIPCICVAGSVGSGADALHKEGMTAIFSSLQRSMKEDALIKHAAENLTRTAAEIARLMEDNRWKLPLKTLK